MLPGELNMFSESTGPITRGGVLCKVGRTALGWIPDYKRLPLTFSTAVPMDFGILTVDRQISMMLRRVPITTT